jgi:hypothetical protein
MKKQRTAKVINFTGGSFLAEALDRQTMSLLRVIAARKGITTEQLMSEALNWFLARRETQLKPKRKITTLLRVDKGVVCKRSGDHPQKRR